MASLLSVIKRVREKQTRGDEWLYIAGAAEELTLQSEAELGCPEIDEESDEEIEPIEFIGRGLQSTIELAAIEACISWADRLANARDDDAALNVIRYYIRFDAFPETLNAPDPPPQDEAQRLWDQAFCEKLGSENPTVKCRREGCTRGVVAFSVLCRRHHFEKMQNRPYPFSD